MLRILRGIGISCCATVLWLVGACAPDGDSGNDGSGTADDGGTGGDDGGGSSGTGTSSGTSGTGSHDGGSDGTSAGTGSSSGTASGSSAGTETGNGTDTSGQEIQCFDDPPSFPRFDKTCGGDQECALVFHTVNCCGTDVAWGINVDEVDRFDAAEAICDSQYPDCDCPTAPTEAEDGNSTNNQDEIQVTCRSGSCMSYIP